ncbi:DUF6924 domain-containing protein [Cellulomonas palmilytica]|uniref:DUF6924 domain-containing protein n=1 Tax=Cellulomonas palmilytica TaxID=2608402 RepID=UPI001F2B3114|nr:hypothetical protein [Cellulomonas palmilytica]UJP41068.1 hypothetical protein F1D97_06325 [Cellulomonas palmilytica]
MLLAKPADMCTLLLRTDYSDDVAWQAAVNAATAVYDAGDFDRAGASLQPFESPESAGLTAPDLVRLPRDGYLSHLAVADARTMKDLTVMFVDINDYNEEVGRTFRAVPQEVEPITANLAIGNLDFFEFADAADTDGVFRGFKAPEPEP